MAGYELLVIEKGLIRQRFHIVLRDAGNHEVLLAGETLGEDQAEETSVRLASDLGIPGEVVKWIRKGDARG